MCGIVSLENEASPPPLQETIVKAANPRFHGSPYPLLLESILQGYPAKGGLGRCCSARRKLYLSGSRATFPPHPSIRSQSSSLSSCRCHCFRASARSSAKRGDRLHRQFVIPWSGYRGQENAAPLSLERERMRGISLFDIRARVIIGPVTLNPFLPFRNAFSYDISFRIPFNFLETRMFRVRRGVL